MKGKSLLILLFLSIGMLTYVYYGIQKPAELKETSTEDRVFRGNVEKLQWIEISKLDQKIRFERQNIGWKLTSPFTDLAAQSKIETLIGSLEKFKKIRVLYNPSELEKNPPAKNQFGLSPAKLLLALKTSDQTDPFVIHLGESNPSATGVFSETADQGILLATMDLDPLTAQGPNDFREMRLSTVSPNDYSEVTIINNGRTLKFSKSSTADEWIMTSPYKSVPLDQEATRSLIEKISFIRATEFHDRLPAQAQAPQIKIIVGFKEGVADLRTSESDSRPNGTEIQLFKLNKGKESDFFAKSDKAGTAGIVQFHYDSFNKSADDLISKSFDHFIAQDVTEMSVTTSSNSQFTVKNPSENEDTTKMINHIRQIRASKFLGIKDRVPSTGTNLQVTLKLKAEKELKWAIKWPTSQKAEATSSNALLWYDTGSHILNYEIPGTTITLADFDKSKASDQKKE